MALPQQGSGSVSMACVITNGHVDILGWAGLLPEAMPMFESLVELALLFAVHHIVVPVVAWVQESWLHLSLGQFRRAGLGGMSMEEMALLLPAYPGELALVV